MDINYFLSSKKKLKKIMTYLHEIRLTYCDLLIEKDNYNDNNDEYIRNTIYEYEKKIIDIELTIENLNQVIYCNCVHDFVEDVIDINPDKSRHIIYCKICELTK